jgi:hypothetical protein
MTELDRLRSALQDLHKVPANSIIAIDKENVDNDDESYPELLRRYKTARNAYIQKKTIESFLSSLRRYDPTTNTFPLPSDDDDAEIRAELSRRQDEVINAVKETMEKVSGGVDDIHMKWEQFCEKRDELSQIVASMEDAERNRSLLPGATANGMDVDDDDEDGVEITEDDVAIQEEKLSELQQRKVQLENRLSSVRAQVLDLEDDCHRTKTLVNEVRVRGGRKPLDWSGLVVGEGGNEQGSAAISQQVETEIAKAQEQAMELKRSCEFYDGIRELMDELGGVKILSSKSISLTSSSVSEALAESTGKRQKIDNEDGFVLTVMLLGRHILEITLSKSKTDKDGLHVMNAKLTTPTTFPMPEVSTNAIDNNNEDTANLMETLHSISLSHQSFSKIMSQKLAVEVTIPALDDLVSWSHSFESSSHGIRFILIETMARIRTLESRVVELSKLRERFASQVYDVEASSSTQLDSNKYGGAEQEVVCAINEGITVALRLGADCPLMPGSVYISEIFGVGGWDEGKLNELRTVITNMRCKGPVEVMELMTKEIHRRSKEDGWVLPSTPKLPRGKR